MSKIIGTLGRTGVKTAEAIAVGATEIPKLALHGVRIVGTGIEYTGKSIRIGSQYGIDNINKAQDRIEAESDKLCATILNWELNTRPIQAEEEPAFDENDWRCPFCDFVGQNEVSFHAHMMSHQQQPIPTA